MERMRTISMVAIGSGCFITGATDLLAVTLVALPFPSFFFSKRGGMPSLALPPSHHDCDRDGDREIY